MLYVHQQRHAYSFVYKQKEMNHIIIILLYLIILPIILPQDNLELMHIDHTMRVSSEFEMRCVDPEGGTGGPDPPPPLLPGK